MADQIIVDEEGEVLIVNNESEVVILEVATQGLVGATGAKGDKGDLGATGLAGATGAKGDLGATGLAGATGAKGDLGATGLAGAVGAKGATGATGATGAKGDKGDLGATGATGATGGSGAKGDKGDLGATGLAGAAGAKGATGATGATGVVAEGSAYGTTNGITVLLPDNTNLQVWAQSRPLPPMKIYNVYLSVPQNGLPIGWYYIDVKHHGNPTPNPWTHLLATAMGTNGDANTIYGSSSYDIGGGVPNWTTWKRQPQEGEAFRTINGRSTTLPYNTNIQTWADTSPADGVYVVGFSATQNSLPSDYYYLYLQSSDTANNKYIRAQQFSAPFSTYENTKAVNWAGWQRQNAPAHGQCKLILDGVNLRLIPYDGNCLTVANRPCRIIDVGVAVSAAGLADNTLYYVYATAAGSAVNAIVCLTTGYTEAGGIKYKADDWNYTLVGMTALSLNKFVDAPATRYTRSWFNEPSISGQAVLQGNLTVAGTSGWRDCSVPIYYHAWPGEKLSATAQLEGSSSSSSYAYDFQTGQFVTTVTIDPLEHGIFEGTAAAPSGSTAASSGTASFSKTGGGLGWRYLKIFARTGTPNPLNLKGGKTAIQYTLSR